MAKATKSTTAPKPEIKHMTKSTPAKGTPTTGKRSTRGLSKLSRAEAVHAAASIAADSFLEILTREFWGELHQTAVEAYVARFADLPPDANLDDWARGAGWSEASDVAYKVVEIGAGDVVTEAIERGELKPVTQSEAEANFAGAAVMHVRFSKSAKSLGLSDTGQLKGKVIGTVRNGGHRVAVSFKGKPVCIVRGHPGRFRIEKEAA